jgi:hypothetical protein
MDNLISEENLEDIFAYLDNITICGRDQAHHDENLEKFMEAANRRNLVFNEGKCVFSTRTISILGSVVSKGEIRPDLERLKPLRELRIYTPTRKLEVAKKSSQSFLILFSVD